MTMNMTTCDHCVTKVINGTFPVLLVIHTGKESEEHHFCNVRCLSKWLQCAMWLDAESEKGEK